MIWPGTRLLVLAMTTALVLWGAGSSARAVGAPASVMTVGVVDFYAPTPLGAFVGIVPERFAAEDLSRLLARSAAARFAVVPPRTMLQAEEAMRWQSADVLHFDRLRELARASGADRLVVGWIPLFSVDGGGERGFPISPEDGNGPPTADVNIVVQVFDRAAARVVAETRQWAWALGATRSLAAGQALNLALERGLPEVVRLLLTQAPLP